MRSVPRPKSGLGTLRSGLRIALVTDWWLPRVGGIESQVADLAAMLVARSHTVRVLTTTEQPVVPPGIEVDPIRVPMFGDIAAPDLRRIAELAERLANARPDVIHAHGMFSSLAIGSLIAARRLDVPSVSTIHSLLQPWPVFVAATVIFRLFSNRASLITAVSAAAANDVRRASGREVVQIPNGVHLGEWRTPHGSSDGVHIVAITRLVRKKSPVDLVYGLHEALRRAPRRRVRMTIAGDGPERSRVEREAARLKISGHLELRGACTRAEVRELLATASMLVQPGRYEAFGLALLEARAAGVPVVAMASGGVPELVEDRRHGLLADTAQAFRTAVAELATNDDLRARCAAAAPQGLERFDWPRVIADHEAVYARAAKNG